MHVLGKSLVLFFCWLCTLQPAVAGSDLVLPAGYELVEVFRDDGRYTGGDGLFIHDGNDHLHDPCDFDYDVTNATRIGMKFATGRSGDSDQADGFLVVNDCQVVSCRKWTSPDEDRDDRFGGETIVYDIVVAEDVAAGPTTWTVLEDSECTCESDNCYLGLFLNMKDYNNVDCQAIETGSPGSIPCSIEEADDEIPTDNAPRPWSFSELGSGVENVIPKNTLSDAAIAGIAAAVGVFVLGVLYCCCCRRKRSTAKNPDEGLDTTEKAMEEGEVDKKTYTAAVLEKTNDAVTETPAKAAPKKKGWFSSSKRSGELSVPTNISGEDSVDTEENSQEETGDESMKGSSKQSSWFGKRTESSSCIAPVESGSVNSEKTPAVTVGQVSADPKTESISTAEMKKKAHKKNQEAATSDSTNDQNGEEAKKNEVQVPSKTDEVECTCCGM